MEKGKGAESAKTRSSAKVGGHLGKRIEFHAGSYLLARILPWVIDAYELKSSLMLRTFIKDEVAISSRALRRVKKCNFSIISWNVFATAALQSSPVEFLQDLSRGKIFSEAFPNIIQICVFNLKTAVVVAMEMFFVPLPAQHCQNLFAVPLSTPKGPAGLM